MVVQLNLKQHTGNIYNH